jgi:Cu(I)/Ag(I) efflux system membrane fusion protein
VDFTGQEVQLGDPMALVYSPTLIATQEELLQSLAAQRQLPPDPSSSLEAGTASRVAAVRDKLRLLGLSPEQIGQIESLGRVEETLTLLAPADGIVIAREVTEGSYVEEGQTIYTLSDLSRVWVTLEVHEKDAEWVRVGQEVTFSVEAFPGERFLGNVAFVQPTVHDESRTVQARVDLPNPSGRLKPGMFVTGEVQVPLAGSMGAPGTSTSLLIPASAPLLTGERALVYVQLPDTETPTFEGRDVVLGPRAGDWYVVLEGLSEGELVVTRGNFKIDSELQIRGQPSMMAPQGGGAPTHDHGVPGPTSGQTLSPQGGGAPTHEHDAPESPVVQTQSGQTPSAFSEQIGALVRVNFEMVRRLSGDDPEESRRASEAALEALGNVDSTLLEGAGRDIWTPLQKSMVESLTALVGEQDFEEMRVPHFEHFSDALIQAVRTFGTGSVAPVYRAMCPMVKGREGSWLQANQEVTNPYHGSRMYTCGSIVETLVGLTR